MSQLPQFFGINLGKDKIKLAEIKYIDDMKARLVSLGSVNSSISLIANESEEGEGAIAKELARCVEEANFATKNCVIAIPELSVFSRLLMLPKVKEEEVEESVHYALRPLIPVPIDTVNISFLQIDEVQSDTGTMVNWYTVAAPKQLIERYSNIVKKAGLNLLAIETESLSIVRMVFFSHKVPENQNVMVIDIGAEGSNIIIGRNSAVVFSQSITTGSNSMTKIVASDFNITDSEAEKYKLSYGLDFSAGDGKIAKSIEPMVQIILGEVSRTLTYLQERLSGGQTVSNIYLTGGGAGLKGLDTYITEKLNIQTTVANPLESMEVDQKFSRVIGETNAREYNVALGLALKKY